MSGPGFWKAPRSRILVAALVAGTVFLISLTPIMVSAVNPTLTISSPTPGENITGTQSYTISGEISPIPQQPDFVFVSVKEEGNPNVLDAQTVYVAQNGSFSYRTNAGGNSQWTPGTYVITAFDSYGTIGNSTFAYDMASTNSSSSSSSSSMSNSTSSSSSSAASSSSSSSSSIGSNSSSSSSLSSSSSSSSSSSTTITSSSTTSTTTSSSSSTTTTTTSSNSTATTTSMSTATTSTTSSSPAASTSTTTSTSSAGGSSLGYMGSSVLSLLTMAVLLSILALVGMGLARERSRGTSPSGL